MLGESLAVLAMGGATTIVAAMATDAWESARTGVIRVLRRASPEERRRVENELDSHAALVERHDDPDAARAALTGTWGLLLADFLRDHPETEGELRDLVNSLSSQTSAVGGKAPTQTNTNSGSGTLVAAMYGDAHVHRGLDSPSDASARPEGESPGGTR